MVVVAAADPALQHPQVQSVLDEHLREVALMGSLTSLTSLQSTGSGCGDIGDSASSQTPSLTDDPKQELADLRRQVVYLQVSARSYCVFLLSRNYTYV